MRIETIVAFCAVVIVLAVVFFVVIHLINQDHADQIANIKQRANLQYATTTQQQLSSVSTKQKKVDLYSTLQYYVILDKKIYGPLSLEQLKAYPLQEDTFVSTNTLGDKWYEAKYFECLDNLFGHDLPFRIDEDGVIIRG